MDEVREGNNSPKSKVNENIEKQEVNPIETEIKNDVPQELENTETTENKEVNFEDENKKLKETIMRMMAEVENTRRIAKKEKDDASQYAISKFATDLINVMENFELAFAHIDESKVDKNFFDGIKLTHNELKKIFENHNLKRINPLNEDFNPELHQAIAQVESELEEGKIAQVMQAGYTLNGRILRPALVGVSKGK